MPCQVISEKVSQENAVKVMVAVGKALHAGEITEDKKELKKKRDEELAALT